MENFEIDDLDEKVVDLSHIGLQHRLVIYGEILTLEDETTEVCFTKESLYKIRNSENKQIGDGVDTIVLNDEQIDGIIEAVEFFEE